jgi:nucleoside-diphosphate-sugar epimerase
VMVTGATGFIGQPAVRHLLKAGHEVHALARHPGAPQPGLTWHACDLLSPGTAKSIAEAIRPEKLLHLAWNAAPGQFWTAPNNLDWAAATIELQIAFVGTGGKRAVFAGTCAEYDWAHSLLEEDKTPLAPKTYYGLAKASTCQLLLDNATRAPNMAWGRIFFLYGPGEAANRLVSGLVATLLAGKPAECTDGSQERDFMHVDDVAGAFVALLDSDYRGAVNIASGTCRPLRDIISEIGSQTGRPNLLRLGARPVQPGEPARLAANVSILRDRIGFRPRFGMTDGIADTIRWWRTQV